MKKSKKSRLSVDAIRNVPSGLTCRLAVGQDLWWLFRGAKHPKDFGSPDPQPFPVGFGSREPPVFKSSRTRDLPAEAEAKGVKPIR